MQVSIGQVIDVGPHRVVCESDLYSITFIGDVNSEHAREFAELNKYYQAEQGYVMCLGDCHQVGTMAAEARKLTAQLNRELRCPGATAIFGANLFARTLATLVLKAIALTLNNDSQFAFFKTEPEARAWLESQRPRLLAGRRSLR